MLDSNTAGPVMSAKTYTAEVLECLLVNSTVPDLTVNASGTVNGPGALQAGQVPGQRVRYLVSSQVPV